MHYFRSRYSRSVMNWKSQVRYHKQTRLDHLADCFHLYLIASAAAPVEDVASAGASASAGAVGAFDADGDDSLLAVAVAVYVIVEYLLMR